MLRIRPYARQDAEYVVQWFEDETTFRRWSADQYDFYPITAAQLNERYESVIKDGRFFVMTALEDNEVVGHFTMRYLDEEEKNVKFGFIVLNPMMRGKGIGKRMLSLALKYAFELMMAEQVSIGVFENNIPARKCYESLGFHTNKSAHPLVYNLCGEKWVCLELMITKEEWMA